MKCSWTLRDNRWAEIRNAVGEEEEAAKNHGGTRMALTTKVGIDCPTAEAMDHPATHLSFHSEMMSLRKWKGKGNEKE